MPAREEKSSNTNCLVTVADGVQVVAAAAAAVCKF